MLQESEYYIHHANPLKEQAYESYKDTLRKTTVPYNIPITHYELLNVDLKSDKMLQDIMPLVVSGDKNLYANLFDGRYLSLEAFKALLTRDTIFNAKNIMALYYGDNGILMGVKSVILFLDKYPENNKEEMFQAYKDSSVDIPKGFDKAIKYLETFKNKMNDGERRILFVSNGGSYYSFSVSESDILTKLPKGKTYVIELEKDDLYRIMNYTKLGFKVRKENKDTLELFKEM